MADNNPSAGEITDNPPVNGNTGAAAAATETAKEAGAAAGKKVYHKEEFVRVRKELTDRLGRVRDELAKVDAEDMGRRAADWVRENPLLAVALASGAGILIGRGLVSLLSSPEPPPLSVRTRQRTRQLARNAQSYVGDVGGALSDRVADTGSLLRKTAEEAKSELSKRASEFSDELTRRTSDVTQAISETAGRAAHSASESAHDVTDFVKDRSSEGKDFAGSLLDTIKDATAAHVVRRVSDWVRRA